MILHIKVKPNSRREFIEVVSGLITVRIAAQAKDGEANKAVIELLSEQLGIPKSRLEITGGAHSRQKRISIPDEYKVQLEVCIKRWTQPNS